jgi:predicted dehydrogenase
MKKINAAVIGMGIGEKHYEALNGYKNTTVKTICESDKGKLKFLSKKYPKVRLVTDINEIFLDKSIDLVSIASYDDTHYRYVVKAIKNNKNIIVEKPMCLNIGQLNDIHRKIKKSKKIKIVSNLVLRVNDLFLKFKKNIDTNKIFYIEADYLWGRKNKLSEWRSKIKGYTITLSAAIHMFDLIMWFLKARPLSVQAFGSNKDNKDIKFKKENFGIYILKFPKNIIAKVSVNTTGAFSHFHEVKIFQTNKTFINSISGSFSFQASKKKTKQKKIFSKYPDKVNRKKLIRNFIDHLNNEKIKPMITLKEQIDLMTVCFAADKSIKFKKKIKINYLK